MRRRASASSMSLSQPGLEALPGVGEPKMPSPERDGRPAERTRRRRRADRAACRCRRARWGRGLGFGPPCVLYTPARGAGLLQFAAPDAGRGSGAYGCGATDRRSCARGRSRTHASATAGRMGAWPRSPPSTTPPRCGPPTGGRARRPPAARAAARLRRRRARPVRSRPLPAARVRRRGRARAAHAAVPRSRVLLVPDRGTRRPRSAARDGCRIPRRRLARRRRARRRRRAPRVLAGSGRRAAGDAPAAASGSRSR